MINRYNNSYYSEALCCTGCLYILFAILPSLTAFAVAHYGWHVLPAPLTLALACGISADRMWAEVTLYQ